jgi:hypothetical protein
VAEAMLLTAYALIGIGILAASGEGVARLAGILAGGALLALAVTGLVDDPLGYEDALRLVVATVLFPAWAVTLLRQAPSLAPAEQPAAGQAVGAS